MPNKKILTVLKWLLEGGRIDVKLNGVQTTVLLSSDRKMCRLETNENGEEILRRIPGDGLNTLIRISNEMSTEQFRAIEFSIEFHKL